MLQQGQCDSQTQSGSCFAVPSPFHNGQSPYYHGQSPAYPAMSPNVYSQTPSPAFSTSSYNRDSASSPLPTQIPGHQQSDTPGHQQSDTPGHQQSDTSEQGSPKFSSLPTVVEDLYPMNKASIDPIGAPAPLTSLSGATGSYPANFSPQGTSNEATIIYNRDGDVQMSNASFEIGTSEVQQFSDHSSMESSSSCHSSVSACNLNNGSALSQTKNTYMESMGNNMFRLREPVSSAAPEHQQEIYMGLQSNPDLLQLMAALNTASPEIIKSLQTYLDQNATPSAANNSSPQVSTEDMVSSSPVVMATSSALTMASSGSMSDPFNFRYFNSSDFWSGFQL